MSRWPRNFTLVGPPLMYSMNGLTKKRADPSPGSPSQTPDARLIRRIDVLVAFTQRPDTACGGTVIDQLNQSNMSASLQQKRASVMVVAA